MFSAVVLMVAGVMRVLDAVWAFRYNGTVVDNLHDAIFGHSLTTYGWVWLVMGIVLILGGIALVGGRRGATATIARWFGVVAAAAGAITAVSWMPYYPVWSITYIAVAAAVIYGLTAHGAEPEVAAPAPRSVSRVTGEASGTTTGAERSTARG